MVNGVLGWAQGWRRHRRQSKSWAVARVDLWTQILQLVEKLGEAIKWLHVPFHIGINARQCRAMGGQTTWRTSADAASPYFFGG